MIVSRTPLRMSFVGGGSDLPAFYDEHGGAVVSTTIDKWIRVSVSRRFEGDVRVCYSEVEIVPSMKEVRHDLVREAMRRTGIPRGVDIVTIADVPSRGTGLGSSSAVTCTPSRVCKSRCPSSRRRPVRSKSTCWASRLAARTSTR
jgi:D-glycero-alpha-D-manno-heptose-7-phosphate kinase